MKIREYFLNLKLNYKFTVLIVIMVMVPIIGLSSLLLYIFKKGVVDDTISQMQYTMERTQEEVETNLNQVNLTTQFFLKDAGLLEMLEKAYLWDEISISEIRDFKSNEVAALERLVNNNAALYGVRVYGVNDHVQEMMPILYQYSRMLRQPWAGEAGEWQIGYQDRIFASDDDTQGQYQTLIGLITPVYDREKARIGTIEAAMTMEEIFPEMYENTDYGWGCLVQADQTMHFGNGNDEEKKKIVEGILDESENKNTIFYKNYIGHEVVVAHIYISTLESELILVKDITDTIRRFDVIGRFFVACIVLLTLIMAYIINKLVYRLLKRLYKILETTHKVQRGDLNVHFDDSGQDEMSELGTQMNKMMDRIKQLMEESIKREILAKNSEIKALQNQINAHFIYNVLESIKMMAEIEERYDISDSITALGELLRYGMKWTKSHVSVEQEVNYIRNYIQLMNLRYDYTIHLSVNMPEYIYQQQIPKMSLQPIVENAICHGIEQLSEDATIYIKAIVSEDDYIIEITDSGIGMGEKQVELLMKKINGEIEVSGGSGNGIGLKNVQDRIQLSFGKDYGIRVVSKEFCFTKICVHLPITARTLEKS